MPKNESGKNKYFSEYAYFYPEKPKELERVCLYLKLWKEVLIKKFTQEGERYELVDSQWLTRPPEYYGPTAVNSTLTLRLNFEYIRPYEEKNED